MKKSLDEDLTDLSVILESLARKLAEGKLTEAERIDVAARLKPVAKACKAYDDAVKELVKNKLNHKEGEVPGGLFKAVLKLIPVDRLNQTAFKETKPTLYKQFVETNTDERVTFELR